MGLARVLAATVADFSRSTSIAGINQVRRDKGSGQGRSLTFPDGTFSPVYEITNL